MLRITRLSKNSTGMRSPQIETASDQHQLYKLSNVFSPIALRLQLTHIAL